jgi:hypothetical protein
MAHDENYSLVEPFDIDDGSLAGLSQVGAFVLGVEWQMFRQQLADTPGEFERQVHTANVERLQKLCTRHGRRVKVTWLHEDYEGWRVIHVSEA